MADPSPSLDSVTTPWADTIGGLSGGCVQLHGYPPGYRGELIQSDDQTNWEPVANGQRPTMRYVNIRVVAPADDPLAERLAARLFRPELMAEACAFMVKYHDDLQRLADS